MFLDGSADSVYLLLGEQSFFYFHGIGRDSAHVTIAFDDPNFPLDPLRSVGHAFLLVRLLDVSTRFRLLLSCTAPYPIRISRTAFSQIGRLVVGVSFPFDSLIGRKEGSIGTALGCIPLGPSSRSRAFHARAVSNPPRFPTRIESIWNVSEEHVRFVRGTYPYGVLWSVRGMDPGGRSVRGFVRV